MLFSNRQLFILTKCFYFTFEINLPLFRCFLYYNFPGGDRELDSCQSGQAGGQSWASEDKMYVEFTHFASHSELDITRLLHTKLTLPPARVPTPYSFSLVLQHQDLLFGPSVKQTFS